MTLIEIKRAKALVYDLRQRINPAYADQRGTESYERKECADMIDQLIAHVAGLDKAQQWRPLTESMPEPMVQVLMWDGAHVFVEQWWGEGYLLDHRITHWMPIPPAPEAA